MKIKRLFSVLKNEKASSSIIAILFATGIVGVSSLALLQYMGNISNVFITGNIEGGSEISFDIHLDVINNLRSLLVETRLEESDGEMTAQSIWGICSLLKQIDKEHGVENINLTLSANLSGQAKNSFSTQRWQNFFDQTRYDLLSNVSPCERMDPSFQSNYFSRCFRYIGLESETSNNTYVIARMVPKQFPDFSNINLNQSTTLDIKEVIFELQVIVGIEMPDAEASIKQFRYNSMIWSNDVVECTVQVHGKWTNVQLSGTGTGRLSNHLVVNDSAYQPPGQCSEVLFGEIPAEVIRGGKIVDGNISADHTKNASLSCRKNTYRCPGDSGDDSDYVDVIRFKIHTLNNYMGILHFNALNFTFLDSNGEEVDSLEDEKTNTLGVDVNNFRANVDLSPVEVLHVGQNRFRVQLKDGDSGTVAQLCKNACDDGIEYYPSFTMHLSGAPSRECNYRRDYMDDQYRLRCTACHSKMCHKVGLGVFGPIRDEVRNGDVILQGLTDEPLDGTIPECALKKSNMDYTIPNVSSGSGKCVALKVANLDSFKDFENANYELRSCSDSLPVLCFAYGHYIPAIHISSPNNNDDDVVDDNIFKGRFSQAQKACYEMGRELIQKNSMVRYFKRFWPGISLIDDATLISNLSDLGLPQSSAYSDHFEYVNNTNRGLFIVPTYQINTLSNWLTADSLSSSHLKIFISNSYNRLWVAMEKDAGGQIIGSIPQATVAKSPFSVFNRKEFPSRALILKDSNTISDTNTDTILTHNLRYKGVYNVNSTSKHRVLCRKKGSAGEFRLTDNTTTVAGAPAACRGLGSSYYFIPPLSSLEWVKALSILNSNDKMYPFPNPGDFSDDNYQPSLPVPFPKAWVGLSKKSSSAPGDSNADWRLSKAHFPDADSIFRPDALLPTTGSPDYIGVIDYKGKPVVPDHRALANFDRSLYKKVCVTDNGGDQLTVESPVKMADSCEGRARAVTGEDISKFKSIKFMSEWVEQNTLGNFVIDETILGEAQTLSKNKICKDTCASDKNTCTNSCSRIGGQEQQKTCKQGCDNTERECQRNCDNSYDIKSISFSI